MFKFIIIVAFILFFISFYMMLKNKKSDAQIEKESIDDLIDVIKSKIQKAEKDLAENIEGAEISLQYYKHQLEKTIKLKEKTKNL